ncbi:MAG: helix-turn-helix transcriptional regulator [Sphingomonadales bacterium]|nr:helix-turn-helix transcriptional regulator [Sphingomonadales bacterium]
MSPFHKCGRRGRATGALVRGFGGFGRGERAHGLFGGHGHHRGEGGRRGKRFAGETLRLMVLALLEGGPQHGYQLIRGFSERSGEAYAPSPGVLYPLLTLLADMGLIEEVAGDGAGKRSFALTAAGRTELAGHRDAAEAALARLAELSQEASRTDPAPVRRAMLNLRTAALQRLSAGDGDAELGFRVAEILDAAARDIERL